MLQQPRGMRLTKRISRAFSTCPLPGIPFLEDVLSRGRAAWLTAFRPACVFTARPDIFNCHLEGVIALLWCRPTLKVECRRGKRPRIALDVGEDAAPASTL